MYNVSSGDIVAELEHARTRLQDFTFVGGGRIVTTADDGMLRLWSIEEEGELLFETGCGIKDRIRAISLVQEEEDDDNSLTDDGANYLAIVFTSGLVQIWLYDSRIDVADEKTENTVMSRICSLTRVKNGV